MATAQDHEVSLKLIVHKTENRVIFAEADNHFADILFSFLTLPLGTITRLVEEQSDVGTGIKVGSLTNLYRSVEDLDLKYFSTDNCKQMLLYPRSDAEAECRRLKVNINDTELTEYFRCAGQSCRRFSSYKNTRCLCGRDRWSIVTPMSCNEREIFFHKTTTLIISDDFSVMPSSSRIISELFNRFDITDVKLLSERVVHLGKKEILNLLKCCLISKTPLTDAFIRTGHKASEVKGEPSNMTIPAMMDDIKQFTLEQFTLKVFVRKSDNKILFSEANEDLINQIFSFLTIPLGVVLRLLGGTSTLGSVDQLYTSITKLQDLGTCLVSCDPPEKNKLMHPKLPWHLSCEKQLLPHPISAPLDGCEINPKLCPASTDRGGAFVKSPAAIFIVNDDLVVKPISSLLSVAFLEHHIPKNGVEEKVVAFGIDQAYKLLKSSLLSESALTHALTDDLLKIPKTEK